MGVQAESFPLVHGVLLEITAQRQSQAVHEAAGFTSANESFILSLDLPVPLFLSHTHLIWISTSC